ncbi:hypothetical protein X975_01033, partial [Stegodyphus mimosarum]
MAGAAGRRNILRELIAVSDRGDGTNYQNSSFPLTPPSPDETVIQHRGQCRKSATYKYDAPDPVFFKTPTKSPKKFLLSQKSTPNKATALRSSPRKRLNLTPEKVQNVEVELAEVSCRNFKKIKLQNFKYDLTLEKGIKALSHAQLVQLVTETANISPEIHQIFCKFLPVPDLTPVAERLYMLQRNVYKSFPRNVWGSQDSSFCYVRVRTHLEAFKRECLELCRQFMDSQHWPTVFEYILLALKLTMGLPNWTSVAHNKIKSSCIKQLIAHCATALKKSKVDEHAVSEIIERLKDLDDDPAVKACINLAKDLVKHIPEKEANIS